MDTPSRKRIVVAGALALLGIATLLLLLPGQGGETARQVATGEAPPPDGPAAGVAVVRSGSVAPARAHSDFGAGDESGGIAAWARRADELVGESRRHERTEIVVEGVVLSSHDRTPVTHALVTFATESTDFTPVHTTVSRDGTFRVRLPRTGRYVVRAEADGFRDYLDSGLSVLTRDQIRAEILLSPIHVLRGRVLDMDRRPVDGALVLMLFQGDQWSLRTRSNNTRTDASGEFETELWAGKWLVSASHFWFLSEGSATVSLPEEDEVTLYMREPSKESFGRIVGRVVDSEGAAVPEANVGLGDLESRGTLGGTQTDSSGNFSFDRVRPGRYLLNPTTPPNRGYAPTQERREVRVEADREHEVELVLPKGFPVEGIVVDESGSPLDQAVVRIEREGDPSSRLGVRSRSDGGFRFPAVVAPGLYLTEVQHRDYRTYRGQLSVPEQDWMKVVLEEGLVLQGTLNTVQGIPVEEFSLSFLDPSSGWPLKTAQFSALDGRFMVRGLEPRPYRLQVAARNQDTVDLMLFLQESMEALLLLDPSNQETPLRILPAGR